MKILIAIKDNNGIDSKSSEHFGHCPFFAIYETTKESLDIVDNNIDHSNSDSTPVEQIMKFKPDVVFTLGIGQRAIKLFSKENIKLKTGDYASVREVIANVDNLKNLNDGCEY